MNVPEKEFREIFCNRCKNPRCELAQGGDSRWANRMITQEDRLLRNPKFADTKDPKYDKIRLQNFLSLVNEAIELNTQESAADWDLKWDSAQPEMFVSTQEPKPVEEKAIPQAEILVEEKIEVIVDKTPDPVTVPDQVIREESPIKPTRVSFLNTPFPSEGVMVDGSPVPTQVPKPQLPPEDPWAVPKKPTNVVPVGAKVVMGGSGGKKNGS